jgi:hypothetical protein
VLPKVADVTGLRALAMRLGAVSNQEPEWTSAGTELLIGTEMVDSELRVIITPQILASSSKEASRRIPLKACAGEVSITRSSPSPTGKLPHSNPEFYRLFMGLPAGAPNDVIALNVTGEVRYVSTKPPE